VPSSVLAAGALVVDAPAHDLNISGSTSVKINSTVDNATDPANDAAVGGDASNLATFDNSATGVITAVGNNAVALGGTMTQLTFTNDGSISNSPGANNYSTMFFSTNLGKFVNNGSISGTIDNASTVNLHGVGSFTNGKDGTITAAGNDSTAVSVNVDTLANVPDNDPVGGPVGSFENDGVISSAAGSGIAFYTHDPDPTFDIKSFVNNGKITSTTNGNAVFSTAHVGTFTNAGTLMSGGFGAVFLRDGVDSFLNTDTGVIHQTGTSPAVNFNVDTIDGGTVGSFQNDGAITADGNTGVGFFDNGHGANPIGSIVNNGTITSTTNGNAIGSDAHVGTFTNAGTLTSAGFDAVFIRGGVDSFLNTSTGVIHQTGTSTAVSFDVDTVTGGTVTKFENDGAITSDGDNAVGFYDDGNGTNAVGSIVNNGAITAHFRGIQVNSALGSFTNGSGASISGDRGIQFNGAVTSFSNAGSITGQTDRAVNFNSTVGSFSNSGTLSTASSGQVVNFNSTVDSFANLKGGLIQNTNSAHGRAVQFNDHVGSFANDGVIDSFQNGVSFGNGVDNGTNTGTITSEAATGEIGVRIDGPSSTFNNSGTIAGSSGVVFVNTTNGSNNRLINSGTIIGTNGTPFGQAVGFNDNPTGSSTVEILTGSKIYGDVNFGQGKNTFDFSGFDGSTQVRLGNFAETNGTLVAGDKLYVFNPDNNHHDELTIADVRGTTMLGQPMLDIAQELNAIIASQAQGGLTTGVVQQSLPLNYVASPKTAAVGAVDAAVAPSPAPTNSGWVSAFGGGSTGGAAATNSAFGGIVAGGDSELTPGTRLGVLGGYVRGSANANTAGQTITTDSGVLGVYGRSDMGAAELRFSLLGAVQGNHSTRNVLAFGVPETATADFSSWFIAPTLGIAVPLLTDVNGTLGVEGSLTYVGGQVAGYTETGATANLTVGQQTISLFDGRVGLTGTSIVGSTNGGAVQLSGKFGLLADSNVGGSTTAVTLLGQTLNATAPGSSAIGAYAGFGLKVPVSDTVAFGAAIDGTVRGDGRASGAGRLSLTASF
jgi:uncharacterized protein with beta-barrel porin domain